GRASPDVFGAVRRELAEELGLTDPDLADVRLTGIAEDHQLRQPELIFRVRTTRTRARIESQVDTTEHHGSWSIPTTRAAVAVAALLLWGRAAFGTKWFELAARAVQNGQ